MIEKRLYFIFLSDIFCFLKYLGKSIRCIGFSFRSLSFRCSFGLRCLCDYALLIIFESLGNRFIAGLLFLSLVELIAALDFLKDRSDSRNGGPFNSHVADLYFLFLKLLFKPRLSIYRFKIINAQGLLGHPVGNIKSFRLSADAV